jgi:hypothetical protein
VDDPQWRVPMPGSSCAAAAGERGGRIRLTVTPRRVPARQRRRFAFRATESGSGRPVEDATIRFAGRLARAGSGGRTAITARLPRPGRYRAVASKTGLRSGSAAVRAVRTRRAPRFTG